MQQGFNEQEKEEKNERVLVDALVDVLKEAIGSENVITDNEEAKRLIDEVNGEDVKYSSDKERQDLTTTIHSSSRLQSYKLYFKLQKNYFL